MRNQDNLAQGVQLAGYGLYPSLAINGWVFELLLRAQVWGEGSKSSPRQSFPGVVFGGC